MAKVLILTGDAVEALEVYYPLYRLKEAGHEVHVAAPTKKTLRTVVHDFEPGWETFTEKQGYKLEADLAFADVRPEEYDGLILPGGRAPEYIRLNEHIPRIVGHFFEANKPVGAICHAALIFSRVRDHLKGRQLTAYTACRPDVESLGATYVTEPLHVDGNLVSAHAWPDLPGFMREFLRRLDEYLKQ